MKDGKKAWDTADPNLPPAARRRAWTPRPDFGPGFVVDPRARDSRRRACRAAVAHIKSSSLDRAQARALWQKLLDITRSYWADHDFDTQRSFGSIKADLGRFEKQLIALSNGIDDLHKSSRGELNGDRSLRSEGLAPTLDHVGKLQADIRRLQKAIANVLLPKYVKVEAIAVKQCLDELEVLYEHVTSKKISRTGDSESSGSGIVFVSPGPLCLQRVINAIDPDVKFEQIHTWLKEPRQAQTTKK